MVDRDHLGALRAEVRMHGVYVRARMSLVAEILARCGTLDMTFVNVSTRDMKKIVRAVRGDDHFGTLPDSDSNEEARKMDLLSSYPEVPR